MQKSPRRHPLAVLRLFLELDQKQMGKLIGLAKATVQAIELKHLKLTEPVAERVVKQTNINPAWLMDGDPKARMLNAEGWFYSKADYENAQGKLGKEFDPAWQKESEDYADLFADHYRDRLHDILFAALKKGRYQWVWWKVETLLEQLEGEFKIPFKKIPLVPPPEEKPVAPVPSTPPRPSAKKPTKKSDGGSAALPTSKIKKKPRGKLRRT